MKQLIIINKKTGELYLASDYGSISIIDIEGSVKPQNVGAISLSKSKWECCIERINKEFEIIERY